MSKRARTHRRISEIIWDKLKAHPAWGWYPMTAVLSVFLFFWLICCFGFNPRLPSFFDGDVILALAIIKSLAQGEWIPYTTPHSHFLGAPSELQMADFPSPENLYYSLEKLISFFTSNPSLIFNIYYIVTFPLAALAFIYAARKFRISYPIAASLGLVFAFLPYHLHRYAHVFLSSYYLIPLMGVVLLWLWSKKPIFYRIEGNHYKLDLSSSKAKLALIFGFLFGIGATYYAYFFCFFALGAGLSAALTQKCRYHFYSALIAILAVVFSLGLAMNPTFRYHLKHGKNPAVATRNSLETETYGLKLRNILVPLGNHRIPQLAAIRGKYQTNYPKVEGWSDFLGFTAILGSLILLIHLLFVRKKSTVFDKLSILWTGGVLLAVIGGGGIIVAELLTSSIRAYNRISIFLAFLGLFAVAFLLQKIKPRISPLAHLSIAAVVVIFGLYDQATPDFSSGQEAVAAEFQSDHQFIQEIEKLSPPGAMILQIPLMVFPESGPVGKICDYSHFRGYLHSNQLKWSYGAMKGRPISNEIAELSALPLHLEKIRAFGYQGIYIDRFGFADNGKALEESLEKELKIHPLVSPNQRLSFFLLVPSKPEAKPKE